MAGEEYEKENGVNPLKLTLTDTGTTLDELTNRIKTSILEGGSR
jgi:hypothetical protein